MRLWGKNNRDGQLPKDVRRRLKVEVGAAKQSTKAPCLRNYARSPVQALGYPFPASPPIEKIGPFSSSPSPSSLLFLLSFYPHSGRLSFAFVRCLSLFRVAILIVRLHSFAGPIFRSLNNYRRPCISSLHLLVPLVKNMYVTVGFFDSFALFLLGGVCLAWELRACFRSKFRSRLFMRSGVARIIITTLSVPYWFSPVCRFIFQLDGSHLIFVVHSH